MIEGKVADENAYVGRTYGQPERGWTYLCKHRTFLMSGDFLKVRVTGASEYDPDWGGRG